MALCPPFTLVSTVFNEMKRLDQTIADIEAQTVQPAEIIITDAGSKDGTQERLKKWAEASPIPIKVIIKPRCNVAEGRNLAIAAASYPLIASTDFGCRFEPKWLETIITPFIGRPDLQVVGGAFSVLHDEVHSPAAQADYILSNSYAVNMDEYYSVSSRSIAYKKEVWDKIGGYPEWLTLAADDTIFWRQIKFHGFTYVFEPEPMVYWLRHKTFKGFGKEAGRYGLGDGESTINFRNFFVIVAETKLRYGFVLALLAWPFLWTVVGPLYLLLLAVFAMGFRPYRFAYNRWSQAKPTHKTFKNLMGCFYMIEVTRWHYIRGYVKGWLFGTPAQKQARQSLRTQIA